MAKHIENHIAKIDLDASGFIRGADEVLKQIDRLQSALDFKMAEKGAQTVSAAIGNIQNAAVVGAQGVAASFRNMSGSIADSLQGAIENAASGVVAAASLAAENVAASSISAAAAVEDAVARCSKVINDAASGIASSAARIGASITAQIQNASGSAQTVIGATVAGVSAKIASIAKVTAIVAAAGVGITAAVLLASGKVQASIGKTVDGIHQSIVEKAGAIKDSLSNTFSDLHTVISSQGSSIAEKTGAFAVAIAAGLGKTFGAIEQMVRPAIEGIQQAIETAFPRTTELLGEWAKAVSGIVTNTFAEMKAKVDECVEVIKFAFNGALEAVQEKFESIQNAVKSFAEKISGHFKRSKKDAEELEQGLNYISTAMGNAAGDAGKFQQAAANTSNATQEIADAAENAASGLNEMGGAANEALGATQAAAANTADAAQEIADASENAASGLNEMGGAANEAFAEAEDGAKSASEATEEVGESAQKSGNGFKALLEQIKSAFDEARKAAENTAKATEEVGERASQGASKIGEAYTSVFEKLGKLFKSFGKDLGELPFKMGEINDKSGLVASGITLAACAVGKRIKELISGMREAKGAADSFESATIPMQSFGGAVETVTGKVSALGAVAFGVLERIGQKAADVGIRLAKSLSVDQISQGWGEYELKMNSVQTIMSGTGEPLEVVNKKLDELNAYADKTIYSFSDMTSNIGKFTNQGVKLDDAVEAIQGISNAAALAGANSQQASHTMYNFAQALSQGYVMNIDWKSVENAMMATTEFKEELIKTGVELGTLKKQGDQVVSLTKDNNGHYSDAFSAAQGFRDNLKAQWLTNDVLIQTLRKYSDETTDLGQRALHAAQDIKTASQLMDTLKEAVGSGWARTFEIIIGNFEEAKQFWTGVNNLISPILDGISDWRNGLLESWRALGGREELLGALKDGFVNFIDILKAAKDGLATFISPLTGEKLKEITGALAGFIGNFKLNDAQIGKVKDLFETVGKGAASVKDTIKEIGSGIGELVSGSGALEQFRNVFKELFGGNDIFTKSGLLDTISEMVGKINSFAQNNIIGTIRENIDGLASIASNAVALINTLFANIGTIFASLGGLLGSIGSVVSTHLDDILAFVEGVITAVSGAIDVAGSLIQKYFDSWSSWMPTLLGFVLDMVGKIGSALGQLGEWLSENAGLVAGFAKAFLALKTVASITGALLKAAAAIKVFIDAIRTGKGLLNILSEFAGLGKLEAVLKPLQVLFKGTGGAISGFAAKLAGVVGPITAVLGALAGVTIVALNEEKKRQETMRETIEKTYGESEAIKGLNQHLADNAEAYRRTADARKASFEQIDSEFDYYQKLADELETLTDSNGKIKDGYEDRVNFIIGILNKQLGTELTVIDGIIQGYEKEIATLDELIQRKEYLALLNASSEDYGNALKNRKTALQEYGAASIRKDLAENNLEQAKAIASEVDKILDANVNGPTSYGYYDAPDNVRKFIDEMGIRVGRFGDSDYVNWLTVKEYANAYVKQEEQEHTEAETAYVDAGTAYFGGEATIKNYEGLSQSVTSGHIEEANVQALKLANGFLGDDAPVDLLRSQADAYKQELERAEYLFSKGTEGYTEETVAEYRILARIAAETLDSALKKNDQNGKNGEARVESANPSVVYVPAKQTKTPEKPTKTPEKQTKGASVQASGNSLPARAPSIAQVKANELLGETLVASTSEGVNKNLDQIETAGKKIPVTYKDAVRSKLFLAKDSGSELPEQTSKGASEKSDATEPAGKSTGNWFLNGLLSMLFGIEAEAAGLPDAAAEGASGNSSVMQGPGQEGSGQYAAGMASSSGLASEAGGALVSASTESAAAMAPQMGAPGAEGGNQYASGVDSAVPSSAAAAQNNASAVIENLSAVEAYSLGLAKGLEWGAGLEAGMAEKIAAVSAMAQKLVAMINATTSFAMKTGSPSKVAVQFGNWWGEGLVIGMEALEKSVKNESFTLSETLVSGASTPLSALSDILSGDVADAMTITPVIDLSRIQNDAGQLRGMLDDAVNVRFGGIDISGLFPSAASGNDNEDDRTLKELQGLRQDMARFNDQLGRLQVRMDTGALVGTLAAPMDAALGRRTTIRGRR